MATYSKRGHKSSKASETEQDINGKDRRSGTADVFNTLDMSTFRAENWIAKNQKYIFFFLGLSALVAVGYLLYGKFIIDPKEDRAADEMFHAQGYFEQAVNGISSDSLFNLSLNGREGELGFLDIAEKYSGTNAANLAHYYAGIAYLNTNKFEEAILELGKFKSQDFILSSIAKGAIGDAFAQMNQFDKALNYYIKAVENNENDFTTPHYLLKAGHMALLLNKKSEALNYFNSIKTNYENYSEASNIDALIGLAQ